MLQLLRSMVEMVTIGQKLPRAFLTTNVNATNINKVRLS